MIRQFISSDLPALRNLNSKDIYLSRILSTYSAYGNTDLAQFWVQTSEDMLQNVLCLFGDTVTLCHFSDGNLDELCGFLYAVQARILLCDPTFAAVLPQPNKTTGVILQYSEEEAPACDFEYSLNPPLREVYEVMRTCNSESFLVPQWEPFYLDLSHRIRHQCAVCVGVREKKHGKLCGCGFTVAQTNDVAILGGICVSPQHREQGYGSQIVKALLNQLNQPTKYVFCHRGKLQEFYQKLNFLEVGSWCEVQI